MMRFTSAVLLLTFVLGCAPAAQEPGGPSISARVEPPASPEPRLNLQRSIQRQAWKAAALQPHPRQRLIPKPFSWTGVSLLGYGGLLFALGAGYGPDHLDCRGDCRKCAAAGCPYSQDTLYRGARVFVASGAAVLAIGAVIGARRAADREDR